MSQRPDPPQGDDRDGGADAPTMPTLSWLDDDEPERDAPDRRRRRLVLLVAGIVPWIIVAVVLLRPSAGDDAARPSAPRLATDPGAAHDAQTAPTAAATTIATAPPAEAPTAAATSAGTETPPSATSGRTEAPGGPVATVIASQGRSTPGASDAAALAVVAARAWLTGVGPQLDVDLPGGPPPAPEGAAGGADPAPEGAAGGADPADGRYLEHVAVEAVDWPAPGAAVVSLLVVLLEVDGQEYRDVHVRRLAVPIRLDADGATVGGSPWWLAAPELAADVIEPSEPVDDPDLLRTAATALTEAGLDEPLARLERTEGWPWLATLGAGDFQRQVWLRPHLGGFVVAGSLPPAPAHAASSPTPTSSPSPAPTPVSSPPTTPSDPGAVTDDPSQEQDR